MFPTTDLPLISFRRIRRNRRAIARLGRCPEKLVKGETGGKPTRIHFCGAHKATIKWNPKPHVPAMLAAQYI